ncbi:hypothetical protein HMPREF1862_01442 [Varibaculum cambriense]|uniref:Uncharacterized protein n=1 Tax=Varibaculum cambriense TaxID=184870 RepID=A0AB34WYR5_9ACTO|nr:hypothetical protein HMPREF1862_01442 [Varibaculum cambriense]
MWPEAAIAARSTRDRSGDLFVGNVRLLFRGRDNLPRENYLSTS